MKKASSIILILIFALIQILPMTALAQSTDTLTLCAHDASGALVSVPSGNCCERINMRIPLLCTGAVSNVSITPIISTSLEAFPFDVEKLNYTLYHTNAVNSGEIIEFVYDFKIRSTAPSGVYETKFKVEFLNSANALQETEISVFVNVIKGYEMPTPDISNAVTPVLMLSGYSLGSEKTYAGEEFTLSLTVKNTSSEESIKNIQLYLTDASGNIMPSSGNSSSAYISSLGRGDSKTVSFTLQSSPDANEAKYPLTLSMSYQGSKSNLNFNSSENITVSILQKQRIKIDAPTIYDTPMVGRITGVSLPIYNMGKTPVYNCMITIEGEGLSLAESFFGGTLSAGDTLRADLEVIAENAGLAKGNLIVTYEDAYGVQTENKVPLEMRVEKEVEVPITDISPDTDKKDDSALSLLDYLLIASAVLVGLAIIIIFAKKGKKKNDEDF